MVEAEVSSGVAAPIVVSGRLWGATSITIDGPERFPPDAEARLEKFTNLVAVALANTQAREELATLADEQAALSRVAVAVATEEDPERLFTVVSEEVCRLFDADAGAIVRYADDLDGAVIVGAWQRIGRIDVPLGVKLPLEGGAITRVAQTGRTARIDLEAEPSDLRERMLAAKVSSGVAAPIVVSGRLWGATSISNSSGPGPFPPGVEERLEKFTSLVAVALANAEAREQLTASRARIVQAGDAERRRLERNLHDGAQQRLVTLALGLRLAESRLPDDPAGAAELLARASEELALSLEELRELARGIHPAILTDRGLTPALEALATRAHGAGRGQRPAAGPAARGDRGCRVLRRLGVARERRQVRLGESSPGRARSRRRPARGRGLRRRRRRRGRRQGIGPPRAGRPGGGTGRPPTRLERGRPGHDRAGRAPDALQCPVRRRRRPRGARR